MEKFSLNLILEIHLKIFFKSEDDINFFFKNICTWEWHINQDIVYDTRPATEKKIKEYPEFREAISAFYGRFQEMIVGVYEQNLKIALELKRKIYQSIF